MSFTNKVVIVIGGSSGIGATAAIQFAIEGANVTIVGRNEEKLKQVADKISLVGKTALIVKADVTKDEEAKQIIQKTVDTFDKIDVLVNSVGEVKFVNIGEANFIETYDFMMNINLRYAVVLTNFAVPYLKQTKGSIVNITGVASKIVRNAGRASLSVSKAGLDQFTKICAFELAKFGIRVNTVCPGPVNTSITKSHGIKDFDIRTYAENNTALKMFIQPVEVADIVLYLASDKARSITGSDYVIDAGYLVNGMK